MLCCQVRNSISAYLDQELTGRDALAVRQHLSGCRECLAECRALERVKQLYRLLPMIEPRPGISWRGANAAEAARREPTRRSPAVPLRGPWRLGLALASAGAALAAALFVLSQPGEPNAVVARTRPALMVTREEYSTVPAPGLWADLSPVRVSHWPSPVMRPPTAWSGPQVRLISE